MKFLPIAWSPPLGWFPHTEMCWTLGRSVLILRPSLWQELAGGKLAASQGVKNGQALALHRVGSPAKGCDSNSKTAELSLVGLVSGSFLCRHFGCIAFSMCCPHEGKQWGGLQRIQEQEG